MRPRRSCCASAASNSGPSCRVPAPGLSGGLASRRIANWLVDLERVRRLGIVESLSECEGTWIIQAHGGPFTITAKADRIDRLTDGGFLLVDYKTGAVPSPKQVQAGFALQLPLEGAILSGGGFNGVNGSPAALEYWRLSGGEPAGERCQIDAGDPGALIDRVVARVAALIDRFDDPATPYLAVPAPLWAPRYLRLPAPRAARRERGRGMRSFDDPDTPQRKAAGPRASVWVSASAGTGKTRVLIDRLLWLMLDGTDPARILCLTFTRAAAAEMANRLNEELANWATLRSGALAETLQKLTGRMPGDATIARARQLFARALETPGGIKIATIHAFCQTLLRRFPLEAGVPTEFAVLDERSAREALIEAGEHVLIAARNGNEPELAEALAVVARYAPEERFGVLMAALAAERGKLRHVLGKGHSELRDMLCQALSLLAGTTEEAVIAGFCVAGAGDETGLCSAAAALSIGSCTDRERGAILTAWCEAPGQRRHMLQAYIGAFLTNEGEIRKILVTRDTARSASCNVGAVLSAEAERVKKFCEARSAAALVEASCALIRLGGSVDGRL